MNRRSLLKALPAAVVAGAAPAAALCVVPQESPIAALHREIVRRHAFLNSDHGLSEEDFDSYNIETVAMADQIVDLPARNADDMLRKIMGYTINGDHDLSETDAARRIFAEARALVA